MKIGDCKPAPTVVHWDDNCAADDIKGKMVVGIEGLEVGSERFDFTLSDGSVFTMIYHHDCCASCEVNEVIGDPADLIGAPMVMSEEVSKESKEGDKYSGSSETWTFYKFATVKGYVTVRWYGSSNGYYSEEASMHLTVQQ